MLVLPPPRPHKEARIFIFLEVTFKYSELGQARQIFKYTLARAEVQTRTQ